MPGSNFPEALRIQYFRIFDKYNETVFDLAELRKDMKTLHPRTGSSAGTAISGEKAEAGSYRFTISVIFSGWNKPYLCRHSTINQMITMRKISIFLALSILPLIAGAQDYHFANSIQLPSC
jgi:hypothetical protein